MSTVLPEGDNHDLVDSSAATVQKMDPKGPDPFIDYDRISTIVANQMDKIISEKVTPHLEDIEGIKFAVANLEDSVESNLLHTNNAVEAMGMMYLEQEVYSRKFNIMLYGFPGMAKEDKFITRAKVLDFSQEVFEFKPSLAASHRLNSVSNAPIIIRFLDLDQRDTWLMKAGKIRSYNAANSVKIGIQPDLPAPIVKIKNELNEKRKTLPRETKSHFKYLAKWPFVQLYYQNTAHSSKFIKADIIKELLKNTDFMKNLDK